MIVSAGQGAGGARYGDRVGNHWLADQKSRRETCLRTGSTGSHHIAHEAIDLGARMRGYRVVRESSSPVCEADGSGSAASWTGLPSDRT